MRALVPLAAIGFVAALVAFAASEDLPPGAAELVEAGADLDQVYERCTSSEFGWCMRPEYMQGREP